MEWRFSSTDLRSVIGAPTDLVEDREKDCAERLRTERALSEREAARQPSWKQDLARDLNHEQRAHDGVLRGAWDNTRRRTARRLGQHTTAYCAAPGTTRAERPTSTLTTSRDLLRSRDYGKI